MEASARPINHHLLTLNCVSYENPASLLQLSELAGASSQACPSGTGRTRLYISASCGPRVHNLERMAPSYVAPTFSATRRLRRFPSPTTISKRTRGGSRQAVFTKRTTAAVATPFPITDERTQ